MKNTMKMHMVVTEYNIGNYVKNVFSALSIKYKIEETQNCGTIYWDIILKGKRKKLKKAKKHLLNKYDKTIIWASKIKKGKKK